MVIVCRGGFPASVWVSAAGPAVCHLLAIFPTILV